MSHPKTYGTKQWLQIGYKVWSNLNQSNSKYEVQSSLIRSGTPNRAYKYWKRIKGHSSFTFGTPQPDSLFS